MTRGNVVLMLLIAIVGACHLRRSRGVEHPVLVKCRRLSAILTGLVLPARHCRSLPRAIATPRRVVLSRQRQGRHPLDLEARVGYLSFGHPGRKVVEARLYVSFLF